MRIISSCLAIGILGLLVLTACNSAEQKAGSSKPVAAANPAAQATSDGVRRITPVELHDLLAKNQAVVIDVRNEASYNAGHIRGAKLIPEAEVANHSSELPKDKLIVTYCS
jgi:predicted sulfurtransferase